MLFMGQDTSHAVYLIAGLGNPGPHYLFNRHNVGFMLVDQMAAETSGRFKSILNRSWVCRVERTGHTVIFAKPRTFMNLSGKAVEELLRHYRIDLSRLLIIYDDIALPLGKIRIRGSGGSGGQKGMQSIIDTVGTEKISRLRIGVCHGPPPQDYTEYLLSDFSQQEKDILTEVLDRSVQVIDTILSDGMDRAMTLYNAAV